MANKKISELPAATPLTGEESLPVVQGGASAKASAKDISKFGYQDVQTVADTTKTLALTDRGSWVRFTNASGCTLTIPTNASVAIGVGESFNGIQRGGKVTITPASGVTVNVPTGYKSNTRAAGSPLCLIKVATNEWDLIGDLEAL